MACAILHPQHPSLPWILQFLPCFIQGFSRIVVSIMILLRKDIVFIWGLSANPAFYQLQETFMSSPVLVHFNPKKPCFLEPDALKTMIGVVASQPDADSKLHPLVFYSQSLMVPERNYHVHNTELLAAIKALEHCATTLHTLRWQ